MKRKGFTLVELLAVIVILAVIALIATPMILSVVEKAKQGAFESSVRGVMEAADLYVASNLPGKTEILDLGKAEDVKKLGIKGGKLSGTVKITGEGVRSVYVSDGTRCGYGVLNEIKVELCSEIEKEKPEIYATKYTKEDGIEVVIDSYDESDVSYIELPNGEKIDVESHFVDGKDDDIKILMIKDKEDKTMPKLKKYFNHVVFNENMSLEEIINGNFDVVVDSSLYSRSSQAELINQLYQNQVNLYTIGNDTQTDMEILKDMTYANIEYTANRILLNEITGPLGSSVLVGIDSSQAIHFKPGVEVWYQMRHNNVTYDTLGYLRNEQNTRWIHSQMFLMYNENIHRRMMYRISGKKSTSYIVRQNGTYTFKAVDIYGNENSIDVNIDTL